MTLEEIKQDNGTVTKVLTSCPFCNFHFGEEPNGSVRVDHIHESHGPEVLDPDYTPTETQSSLGDFAGAD